MNKLMIIPACLFLWAASELHAYDPTDYEEWGGLSFRVQRSMDGDVYGFSFQSGVWLVGTPVFGEASGGWLSNRMEDGNYSSIGFTLRLLPRTDWAPFIGAGGGYQSLLSDRSRRDDLRERDPGSYWSGHVEGGLRVWFGEARHFLEAHYRHTWPDTSGGLDYPWIGMAYGRLL